MAFAENDPDAQANITAFRQALQKLGRTSYGNDLAEQYRQAASYVDRILRGEKPSAFRSRPQSSSSWSSI
jgi:hypothetical protein